MFCAISRWDDQILTRPGVAGQAERNSLTAPKAPWAGPRAPEAVAAATALCSFERKAGAAAPALLFGASLTILRIIPVFVGHGELLHEVVVNTAAISTIQAVSSLFRLMRYPPSQRKVEDLIDQLIGKQLRDWTTEHPAVVPERLAHRNWCCGGIGIAVLPVFLKSRGA